PGECLGSSTCRARPFGCREGPGEHQCQLIQGKGSGEGAGPAAYDGAVQGAEAVASGVSQGAETVASTVSQAAGTVASDVQSTVAGASTQVKQVPSRLRQMVEANPVPLGLVGIALGGAL